MDDPDTVSLDLASLVMHGVTTRAWHLGRSCIRLEGQGETIAAPGVELRDGVIEADLCVARERAFPGLLWRIRGDDAESFFVRPHQVGNPDSIQYTPVSNGISSWQLYHGPGAWAAIDFPIDRWFRLRVAFSNDRAETFIDDLDRPILASRLVHPPITGGVGILPGGGVLHVARFAWRPGPIEFRAEPPPLVEEPRAIRSWEVSDPFPESLLAGVSSLLPELVAGRRWTAAEAAPDGLLDLARLHGIRDGRNTVLARTRIPSADARVRALQLGFSDRAIAFLGGRPLFRGDDGYRTRDYRFLGSIGWWDTVYLPLEAGANELVVAVSEDFGGWGLQARFVDA